MGNETVLMPRALTAENGAKSLLMGEYFETSRQDCPECYGDGCEECGQKGYYIVKIPVRWTTIKAIYAKCVEHFGS